MAGTGWIITKLRKIHGDYFAWCIPPVDYFRGEIAVRILTINEEVQPTKKCKLAKSQFYRGEFILLEVL